MIPRLPYFCIVSLPCYAVSVLSILDLSNDGCPLRRSHLFRRSSRFTARRNTSSLPRHLVFAALGVSRCGFGYIGRTELSERGI